MNLEKDRGKEDAWKKKLDNLSLIEHLTRVIKTRKEIPDTPAAIVRSIIVTHVQEHNTRGEQTRFQWITSESGSAKPRDVIAAAQFAQGNLGHCQTVKEMLDADIWISEENSNDPRTLRSQKLHSDLTIGIEAIRHCLICRPVLRQHPTIFPRLPSIKSFEKLI